VHPQHPAVTASAGAIAGPGKSGPPNIPIHPGAMPRMHGVGSAHFAHPIAPIRPGQPIGAAGTFLPGRNFLGGGIMAGRKP
jgi:hypothetical protein